MRQHLAFILGCSAVLGGCDLIDLGLGAGSDQAAIDCAPANPDAYVFDQAICLCGSMDKRGSGVTSDSFSSFGNTADTQHRGNVGINGDLDTIGNFRVDGALTVAGDLTETGNLRIATDLAVGQDFAGRGHVEVAGDAEVGGSMDARGYLSVGGTLDVAGAYSHTGQVHGVVATGAAVSVAPPCGCDPASLIDVAAEVAANRGAAPLGLQSGQGQQTLVLGSGSYYDDGAAWRGAVRIRVEGTSRVYIEGDLDLHGSTEVELSPGSELDLYIAGSVSKAGRFVINRDGAVASRAVRIYVAGGGLLELAGNQTFGGSLYAPQADIDFNGNFRMSGSLFANNLVGRGLLLVSHDRGVVGEGDGCEATPDFPGSDPGHQPGGGGDGDPGDDDAMCSEVHPELCPGGTWPGDGEYGTPGSGSGSGVDDPSGGDGSDPGSGGSLPPGSGTSTDPGSGGSTGGDPGADGATCSEEHPELCPGGSWPGGDDYGTPSGGGGTGVEDPSSGDGSGTDPGTGTGTGTGTDTGTGTGTGTGSDPGSGSGSTDDGSSGGSGSTTTCSEENLAACLGG